MSFSSPTPPDPTATSNAQQTYNTDAAKTQNQINSYNQTNPYGSMTYVADPSSPSGYTLKTALSDPNQNLLNTQFGSQAAAGTTAQNLIKNTAGMYGSAPDLNGATGAVASKLNDWSARYVQPIYDQQNSNLEAQLRSQGLNPGSEAYNNAKNLLARNQGDTTNQYLQQNEGQAYGQAVQDYQLPLQTIGSLFGMAQPTGPTFASTPTAQIQPPNYQGAAQNAYQGQLSNYENNWNNIAKLGVAAAGVAGAPFTGGLSLGAAGGLAGMFGGGGPITYGSPSGPTAFYGNNTSGGWG